MTQDQLTTLQPEGYAAQACRSDITSGYQSGLYQGFLYGAMTVVAVLGVVKGASIFI